MSLFAQALVAGVVIGLLSGLVGTVVVLRRRAFFTVALTHATFPGGVVAAVLGVNIVIGAAAMGLLLVALMLALGRIRRQGRQVAAGIVLAFGYALGMFLHTLNPQLPTKVESYLTGSILGLSTANFWLIVATLVVTAAVLLLLWKELLFSSFDRPGFVAAGYRESRAEVISLLLITTAVVVTMPAIGSILAIAMLAAPAAAARALTRNVAWMVPLACLLGALAAVVGLTVSLWFDLAAGGAIALAAAAIFVLARAVGAAREAIVRGAAVRVGA